MNEETIRHALNLKANAESVASNLISTRNADDEGKRILVGWAREKLAEVIADATALEADLHPTTTTERKTQ